MKVKCLGNVFSFNDRLVFKKDQEYPTCVYKDMLFAQTESRTTYPEGYEMIAHNIDENWIIDEWFGKRLEIID